MPRTIQITRSVPVRQLEQKLKNESNRRLRDRMQAVLWVKAGVSLQDAGKRIGRCRQSVSGFIDKFNKEGLSGLLQIGRGPGRQSRLTKVQWAEVVGWIRSGPRELGLPFSNWDCKRLAIFIHKNWKVKLSDEQVRRQLYKLGCRLLRPTRALPGKDPKDRAKKNGLCGFCWLAPAI